jgi:bacillopeptidase F
MNQSRLSRTNEQRMKQRLVFTIVGTVVLLVLLVKFGIPALVNFSLFLSSGSASQSTSSSKQSTYLTPPILNPVPTATNSASFDFSGIAQAKQLVKLYVNDTYVDSVTAKDDGSFSFKGVNLSQGQNVIKAKVKKDAQESDFSQSWTITYKNNAPSLSITQPADGQSFSGSQNATITVAGKTDPDVKITVNDFWAITDNSGNYSYNLHLQNGSNQIKVIATDTAGNKTEKDITVSYSQ